MRKDKIYGGIDDDDYGGMTPNGTIIRDAWVFGIIPESERCKGWSVDRFQILYDKVFEAWAPYGHLVGNLPPDLREKHERIHKEAFEIAKKMGWSAELGDDD